MDASVCGLPAQSYPDSRSGDHAGDLIGGFSTLLPVVACNYCYRPPSSFKLLLFFLFFTINSYFRTDGMYQGSRLDSISTGLKWELLSTQQSWQILNKLNN